MKKEGISDVIIASISLGTALCPYCKEKEGDYYQKEIESLQELEEKFTRLWTECQRCQGARLEDVLCTK